MDKCSEDTYSLFRQLAIKPSNELSFGDYQFLSGHDKCCGEEFRAEKHKALQISLHPLNILARRCRQANDTRWRDPVTGEPIKRNKGELIALIHSEISECLEGLRKNLPDDRLPQFPMELVELADALVRIFDYVGEYYPASEDDNGINLGNAFEQKMAYNAQRKDHKPENRILDKGKRF